ncbi:hypothetical protein RHMOL_Rhmol13G0045200 [Rhododendron molle]|uniref:Uncharacterized protein n=1 Tax=Rhododendron molle TaxID=49168 RepID=A0ACC0L411_RHOML|nr:hypothetical protein RHMOL_Rhmol13G0045200 [Rhododendron molle]
MRARKKSPAIAVKKTIDQKEDDDGETQIKETEQEKNDIETPQKRRASQKSPVKKTQSTRITRNQDDDGETQIKEAEQEKSNIETPQKGRASKKSPVKKTQSRRITRSLTKREIRTTRVSKKMETTIEIKKKHVQKSDKNKQTGNEEEDEEEDEEKDEEESEEDEVEDKEDVEDVKEDEEEDKFVKFICICYITGVSVFILVHLFDVELEPNNEKEKKLLHFLDQIEVESDVKDDDTRECSLDHDGSKSENDEGVEETNNDTNNLISDLLKEIDRLKEESKEKDKDKERDKEKRQEDEESKEGGVDRSISERVEIATGLHDDGLDDMDKEGDIKKRQEDEESKEGGVDRTISERVEISTGLHDEILPDEVIDKTICQIFKDTQEGERKEKKKRKREQDDIDPPSMVKDLKGKDDRTVKTEEGFIYYRKNQKERKKSNSVFEMTKLFNYISKEDMELLDTIYEFEKGDKKAFVWYNQANDDTVTIEDILNLLNEGDIGNTFGTM